MHKTQRQAERYAKSIANIHGTPRIVVRLPREGREARASRGITGDFYGGVEVDEMPQWAADGAVEVARVMPDPCTLRTTA